MDGEYFDAGRLKSNVIDFVYEQLQRRIKEQECRVDEYVAMSRYWLAFWGAIGAFFLINISSDSNTLLSNFVHYFAETLKNLFSGVLLTQKSQTVQTDLITQVVGEFVYFLIELFIKLLIIGCLVLGALFILYSMVAFCLVITQHKHIYTSKGVIQKVGNIMKTLFKKKEANYSVEHLFFSYPDIDILHGGKGDSVVDIKRRVIVDMQEAIQKNTDYLNKMSQLMSKGYFRFVLGIYWIAVSAFVFFVYVTESWEAPLRDILIVIIVFAFGLALWALFRRRSSSR